MSDGEINVSPEFIANGEANSPMVPGDRPRRTFIWSTYFRRVSRMLSGEISPRKNETRKQAVIRLFTEAGFPIDDFAPDLMDGGS